MNAEILSDYAIVEAEGAQTFTVATHTSSAVDTTSYDADRGVLYVTAEIAGGATIDCKVQSSTTSGGSYADITGAAITQITATGDESVEFALDPGEAYLKTVTVCGTGTAPGAVILFLRKRIKT